MNKLAVIDAGLAVKAILPNPDFDICQDTLEKLADFQLVAPALWMYEVTSAVTKAAYAGQLSMDEGQAAIAQASALRVSLIPPDEFQSRLAFNWTVKLKRIAAYDSFYLAMADHLGAGLWTADKRLFNALGESRPAWFHFVGMVHTPG